MTVVFPALSVTVILNPFEYVPGATMKRNSVAEAVSCTDSVQVSVTEADSVAVITGVSPLKSTVAAPASFSPPAASMEMVFTAASPTRLRSSTVARFTKEYFSPSDDTAAIG